MFSFVAALACAAAPVEISHRRVATEDGAALALSRFRGPSVTGAPVLMIADLGFGRGLLEPLARAIAQTGRVVFVAELRGQGASSSGASLRSWLHLDLPSIARVIASDHPGPVDLIAHGWAGTIALAATRREVTVRRVVALNTPFDVLPPPDELRALLLTDGFTRFATSPEGAASFERLFVMGSQINDATLEAQRIRLRPPGPALAREWLAWLDSGDLPLDDGSTVRERLVEFDRPTLLLLALGDNVAGAEGCARLRTATKAKVTVRLYSKFVVGDDFAHVTLFTGSNAPRLVFPEILHFLSASEVP